MYKWARVADDGVSSFVEAEDPIGASKPYKTLTANYVPEADGMVIANNSADDWIVTLPAAVVGNFYRIGRYGAGRVTVVPDGAETFTGTPSTTTITLINAGSFVDLFCHVAGVWTVNKGASRSNTAQTLATETGASAGDDTLVSCTIEEDLHNAYRITKVRACGGKTGATDNKTLKFFFGSQSATIVAAANDILDWVFEATITHMANNSHICQWSCYSAAYDSGMETFTDDLGAADVLMKITANAAGAADTVTCAQFEVWHE